MFCGAFEVGAARKSPKRLFLAMLYEWQTFLLRPEWLEGWLSFLHSVHLTGSLLVSLNISVAVSIPSVKDWRKLIQLRRA